MGAVGTSVASPAASVVTPSAWIAAQAATPSPTASPTPTAVTESGGLGAAVLLLGVFVVLAVLVTVGAAAVAGWVAVHGSLLTLETGPRQRRLFGVAAVSFALAFGTVLLGFGPTTTVAFYSLVGIGGLALVAGAAWVLGGTLWDRLGE